MFLNLVDKQLRMGCGGGDGVDTNSGVGCRGNEIQRGDIYPVV